MKQERWVLWFAQVKIQARRVWSPLNICRGFPLVERLVLWNRALSRDVWTVTKAGTVD